MPWPAPDEYSEAVQNPATSLCDPDLIRGYPACNALGLPIVSTGAFASVYRFRTDKHDYAVRCFLRDLKDRQERYLRISEFIHNDSLPSTVDFQFIERGILVNGVWYPILKMEWVEGVLLNQYVEQYVSDRDKIAALAESFRQMVLSLRKEGVAHGDLQHGNILICGDEFRLVDYDGMFVPSLEGGHSNELGHPNYQHPKRCREHFGADLDNFASWIIYITLRCICEDPTLWKTLKGGDERLLFSRLDYLNPSKSIAIAHLLTHKNANLRSSGEMILELLDTPFDQIPALDEALAGRCKPVFSRLLKRFGLRAKATLQILIGPRTRPSGSQNGESEGNAPAWFQSPDWHTTQQAKATQFAAAVKWYENWADAGNSSSTGPADASQGTPGRPLPPLSATATGIVRHNPAATNQQAALNPPIPGSASLPANATGGLNSQAAGYAQSSSQGTPQSVPGQAQALPSPSLWAKLSLIERQRCAASFSTLGMLHLLKTHMSPFCDSLNHSDFETVTSIAAYKCFQGEADAHISCIVLCELIVDMKQRDFALLPAIQSSLELSFVHSSSLWKQSPVVPEWISRSYFRALDALVRHRSMIADADLYSYLRTWTQLPATSALAVEKHLLELFHHQHLSGEYRQEILKTIMLLIELHFDLRVNSASINRLTALVRDDLTRLTSDNRQSLHVKLIAQEALARLPLFEGEQTSII